MLVIKSMLWIFWKVEGIWWISRLARIYALVPKCWFMLDMEPPFALFPGMTLEVSTQISRIWSASNGDSTQIVNHLRQMLNLMWRKCRRFSIASHYFSPKKIPICVGHGVQVQCKLLCFYEKRKSKVLLSLHIAIRFQTRLQHSNWNILLILSTTIYNIQIGTYCWFFLPPFRL